MSRQREKSNGRQPRKVRGRKRTLFSRRGEEWRATTIDSDGEGDVDLTTQQSSSSWNRRETGRELCGLRSGARRRRSRLIMDRSGSAGRQAS